MPGPSTRGQTFRYITPSSGVKPAHTTLVGGGCGAATLYVHGSGGLTSPPSRVVSIGMTGRAPMSVPLPGVDAHNRQTPVRGLVLAHPTGGSAAAMPRESTSIETSAASAA